MGARGQCSVFSRGIPVWLPYSQLDFDNGSLQHTLGVDFKYQAPNGVTHVATLNPDFKNIEGEVESIDFSYTERFVRDRRPFFLEGRQFFPSSALFHSTRIDQVDVAYKSFGSDLGRVSYGALATGAFGDAYNLVTSTGYRLSDKTQSSVFFNQVYHWADGEDNAVWETGANVHWVRDPARWGIMASAARSSLSLTTHRLPAFRASVRRSSFPSSGSRPTRSCASGP